MTSSTYFIGPLDMLSIVTGFALGPTIEAFEELLVDELDRKYKNDRWRKFEDEPSEFKAITWLRTKKGLNHINPKWLPPI